VCDDIGDGGADLDPPLSLVELDPQAEGVARLARTERLSEIRDAVEALSDATRSVPPVENGSGEP